MKIGYNNFISSSSPKAIIINMRLNKKLSLLITICTAVGFIPLFSVHGQLMMPAHPESVMLNVPFASQIPTGNWNDPRQLDGCEEASIIMAMAWTNGGNVPGEEVERDIINMSEYERAIFGFYQDTSAQDTARLMREFYQYQDVMVRENIGPEDIKQELAANRVVIIPINTRLTGLAMYRGGTSRHTVVAVGYDDASDQIIIHDPLYKTGQNIWIPSAALGNALSNYHSGNHLGGNSGTALISVGKADILYE
jgi:Peptidase_C39 like family